MFCFYIRPWMHSALSGTMLLMSGAFITSSSGTKNNNVVHVHGAQNFIYLLAARPPRCGVTVVSRLHAAIGLKLVAPHDGLQVSKCRVFGSPIRS